MANRLIVRTCSTPELAPAALVGQRGVDEAVEQDEDARVEQRRQALAHELGAGRRVEQRLRARVHRERGVHDEAANTLGHGHASGLAQQLDADAALSQRAVQAQGERRLAGAVEPLDRDQTAARHGTGR